MARFICEVSSNHAQSIERSLRFIDRAAEIGCWGVKFQLFRIDEMFAPEILAASAEHRRRRRWELPESFIAPLAGHARNHGIQFGCTPFYLRAVDVLEPHVDFFKIASYELLWSGLLERVGRTGKPVILSTGMATLTEILTAVDVLTRAGASDLELMHCVSAYPTPVREANLAAIETLREATGCPVGWSDHTHNVGVVHRAVETWNARSVEFHMDLEGDGAEFAPGHCWLPQSIEAVIARLDAGATLATDPRADGDGSKAPRPAELADCDWRADPEDGLRPLKRIRKAAAAA